MEPEQQKPQAFVGLPDDGLADPVSYEHFEAEYH